MAEAELWTWPIVQFVKTNIYIAFLFDPGHESLPDEPRTEMSTCNTSSWLRDHNMDADIHSYARGRLLQRDEYFFRLWAEIPKSKKKKSSK